MTGVENRGHHLNMQGARCVRTGVETQSQSWQCVRSYTREDCDFEWIALR